MSSNWDMSSFTNQIFLSGQIFKICRNVQIFIICYFLKLLPFLMVCKWKNFYYFLNKYIIFCYHCPSQKLKTCIQQLTFRMSWESSVWKFWLLVPSTQWKTCFINVLFRNSYPCLLKNYKQRNAGRGMIKSVTTSVIE